jgi:hypothetical protein
MVGRTVLVCLVLLGGCGEVIQPQQCPAAQDCNGVCCGAGETCQAGVCSAAPACAADELSCNDTCIDGTSDPLNCGDCGVACGTTATCSNSSCNACPANQMACDNACVNTQTDVANCGMCGKTCDTGAACVDGACLFGYYVLTGTPNPMTVFNTIAETYKFPNNLSNTIWQRESNTLVTGEFSQAGYWAFTQGSTGYATTPDHETATGLHSRLVLVPATDSVIYTIQTGPNTTGPSMPGQIMIATISRTTGLLGTPQTAVFSDGMTTGCQLHSASATQFLCLTGNNTIRRYATARGSGTLTFVDAITLSTAVPAASVCGSCFGGVFAFDGAFFYFPNMAIGQTTQGYMAYAANGAYTGAYTVTGAGGVNSLYFDWSVGRYSTHDGYGDRVGGTVYTTSGLNDSDTHNFSPVATTHTLH